MKLGEVAKYIGGRIEKGKESLDVTGVSSLDEATKSDITFFADPRYKKFLTETKALSCVIQEKELPPQYSFVPIIVDDIHLAVVKLLELFEPNKQPFCPGISPKASISPSARIGEDVYIGEFVYIGDNSIIGNRTILYPGVFIDHNVIIGDACVIYPNVVIRKGCKIGSRVIIHPGAVIGSDGFGYFINEKRNLKVPQIGGVIIEDDCEIGANTTIDRGTIHDTVIGKGCKLDNLIHIAHNVRLGNECFLAAQVGISGSTTLEDKVLVGGQAGLTGHIRIGKGTLIGAKSGVSKSYPAGVTLFGYPAKEEKKIMRELAALSRLTELFPKLTKLIKDMEERYDRESKDNSK
ncbi:MAG: UDP-3-O-(3-hydroxymyristoyl)glucosamine N-acyltransferase [bacterium]